MRSTRFRLHVGIEGETGKGDGKGRKGGGKESGCMSPRWVGSDAFLLVPFPFLSLRGQLNREARDTPTGPQKHTHTSKVTMFVYCICQITSRSSCHV